MNDQGVQETISTDSTICKNKKVPKTKHPGLGNEFEVLLPAYLALRFFSNKEIKDFRLRSNVQDVKKFDDVLIDLEMENGSEHHFLLQLKHKENAKFKITPTSFHKAKDFDLEKYCDAYHEKLSKYKCIIYTNANFNPKKINDVSNFKMISCEDGFAKNFLDTSGRNGNVYKFEVNENTSKEHDFERFFLHFSLFVSQKNSANLEKEIENIFEIEYAVKDDKISTEYINLFRKWHNQQFTNCIIDRKMLSIILVDLLLGHFVMKPSNGTINRDEKLYLLEVSIRIFDVSIIEDSELKLVEELGKCENENCLPSYIEEILEEYVKIFNTDKESLILRLALEYKIIDKYSKDLKPDKKLKVFNYLLGKPLIVNYNENSKHQISKVLQMDFKENVPIKFVLVGKEIDSKQFRNLKIFNTLKNLCISNNNLYQKIINKYEISLQGREKVKLEKLVTLYEELAEFIKVKHLFEENFRVGEVLEELPQYYIDRTVSCCFLNENEVVEHLIKKNNLLIIDYGVEYAYVKDFAQKNSSKIITVDEFMRNNNNNSKKRKYIVVTERKSIKNNYDQLCSMTHNNIYVLKINKPGEFILIKSRDSDRKMDLSEMYIKETEIPSHFYKGVHILCAEPGMGKTTTMKTIRNNYPSDYWTIFVELKQFDFFFEKDNFRTDEILDYFLNKISEDALSREVRNVFLGKRKVALFLDGLDEVNYQCIDNVLRFIKKLKEEEFNVWVSLRNNLREKIESQLNQFSVRINKINEEQKKQYITDRLRCDDNYSHDEIDTIIKSIFYHIHIKNNSSILEIPLQLFMVTQVLIEDKETNLKLNDELFILTKLYTSYFEGKIKHVLHKDGVKSKSRIENIAKLQLKQYKISGLKSCLNDNDWKKLNLHRNELKENEEFINDIQKNGDDYGIIKSVNEGKTATFIHHTHGEYFAAIYLTENFDKVQMLGDSFLTGKYDNLRLLFDIKLAENNPLHLSIIYNNREQFEKYIGYSDTKDTGGRTPLHIACMYGTRSLHIKREQHIKSYYLRKIEKETDEYMQIIDKLVKSHSLLEQDEVFKWNFIEYALKCWKLYPLEAYFKFGENQICSDASNIFDIQDKMLLAYYATRLGYLNLLSRLILANDFRINKKYDEEKHTLLHIACKEDHNDISRFLIQNNADVNSVNMHGNTPLLYACKRKNTEIALSLIQRNADMNRADKVGNTPLHYACIKELEEIASSLIENNADVNRVNKHGDTPLLLACTKGLYKISRSLIQKKANINVIDKIGNTPLLYACKLRHSEIADLLIENNANVNGDKNTDRNTSLHFACKNGLDTIVTALIKNNADVNIHNKYGDTPLHYACMNASRNIVELLIENNAHVNSVNNYGHTPLHYACKNGWYEIVDSLIKNKADVNVVDKKGDTPLHYARKNRFNKIVDLLISNNANVNSVNKNGDIPLSHASNKGYNETVTFLTQNEDNVH